MPIMHVSGWYKNLNDKDFSMQIYTGYILGALTFSLPITVLVFLNNFQLRRWSLESIGVLLIVGANLGLDLKGIMNLNEKIGSETLEFHRKQLIKKHHKRALHKRRKKMKRDSSSSSSESSTDDEEHDIWKSQSFSSQRIYRRTLKFTMLACLTLVVVYFATTLTLFSEVCYAGFYSVDPNKEFVFGDDQICGVCDVNNCEDC